MTLKIEVTGELEAALLARASKQGLSADRVARSVLADALTPAVELSRSIPELPILQLGAIGSLHRRDIYDDVR